MLKNLVGSKLLTTLTTISLFYGLLATLVDHKAIIAMMPPIAFTFLMGWLVVAIISALLSYKEFVCGFLLSAFSMMIAWRIAGIYNIEAITIPLLFTFIFLLSNFIYCAKDNIAKTPEGMQKAALYIWQLIFIRMYIGFDFIPHFTEKLFAGPIPHQADVQSFVQLGVPHADAFVWLAGCCEFGAGIALCLGLLLRAGALGTVIYLGIATYLGHHFLLGFIWAGPGGGWEFATMWMILILSFALTGAHEFSIDQRLEDLYLLPRWITRWL
jgi:putative oxidoreductase